MNRELVQKGTNKLFIAEILTIVGGFSDLVIEKNIYIAVILVLIDIAAYYMCFDALKQCKELGSNFRKAYKMTIVGMVACVAYVVGHIFNSDSTLQSLETIGNALDDLCELLVVYLTLTALMEVFQKMKKEKLASSAGTARIAFLLFWACAQMLVVLSDPKNKALSMNQTTAVLIETLLIAVGEIIYLLYLNKARK